MSINKKKLKYLKRLLDVYLLFIDRWETYSLIHKKGMIHIVWQTMRDLKHNKEIVHYLDYTVRSFPEEDINKKIISFKQKIIREFKNRHNNSQEVQKYHSDKDRPKSGTLIKTINLNLNKLPQP